ncbi:MAG: hypothetical protein LBF27_13625 [Sphingobacterium sp.]|jgi:hypothetical protein|nr:hypothetical protein [Sphingobacterium sp.]
MDYKKHVYTGIRAAESTLNSRIESNDFNYFYDCIDGFLDKNEERFFETFEEFGMQFENEYHISEIIQKIFYLRSEQGIVAFYKQSDIENFAAVVDAYYWLNLAFIKGYKANREIKGEFFQDVVFAALLAYCFYPHAVAATLDYLIADYNQSFKDEKERVPPQKRKYDKYYSFADVFQLLKVFLRTAGNDAFDFMIDVTIEERYQFAINHYLSEDPHVVNEVLERLAEFRVDNIGESYLDTFNHDCWKVFPLEMLSILICRKRNGLSNRGISHPLIAAFAPFIHEPAFFPVDELTKKLASHI